MNLSDLNNVDLKNLAQAPLAVKAAALGFVFLVILGAGYYFAWSPALGKLRAAEAEEQTLRSSYETKKRQAIHYEAYKRRLAETEKALVALLRQLPNRSEMDSLLADINQAGVGRGLEFDLFKPGSETPAEFYATLPVTIKVSGGYHDLGNFVSDVARLPRIVTIHDISLTPSKDSRLVMDAVVRTYRYLDENELAKSQPAAKDKKGKKP